jgi:coenzyme F420-dependent glucose-6-phosphate dehydrogenase
MTDAEAHPGPSDPPARRAHIGYSLSSEEHAAPDLVRYASRAEAAGFEYGSISDHFHPWVEAQGNSPFAWSVMGAIANATTTFELGTGVTCPSVRYHPAIVAQAAATQAALMPGRFFLGVGTGEQLNEHIVGRRWPPYEDRAAMLEEAVEIIRALWTGATIDRAGRHFTVDNARLYSLPDEPPPVIVAAAGPKAAALAARIGDGLINPSGDASIVEAYRAAGGRGPAYLQVSVCWHEDEAEARRLAVRLVPTVGLPGELGNLLPSPTHYQQAATLVTEDALAKVVTCGPDPERHIERIRAGIDAGYDHVHVYQVGPDQEGFFRFYERDVLPALR